jgi:hypothetical protein
MGFKTKRFSRKMRKSCSVRGGGPKFKKVEYDPNAHLAKSRKSRFSVVPYNPNAHVAKSRKSRFRVVPYNPNAHVAKSLL